jgi:hypothetical protein
MATANVNGARIFYERNGTGDVLVLVHRFWVFHHSWDLIVPAWHIHQRPIAFVPCVWPLTQSLADAVHAYNSGCHSEAGHCARPRGM